MKVAVLEQRHPTLIEVVHIIHRPAIVGRYRGGSAHHARSLPAIPPPRASSERSPRRWALAPLGGGPAAGRGGGRRVGGRRGRRSAARAAPARSRQPPAWPRSAT